MKRKVFAYFLILALCFTILGTGCSKSSGDTVNETKSKEPVEDGQVVMAIEHDMDSLDPHFSAAAGTKEILFNIFEGLMKADEKGNLNPAVAQDYSVSEDGLTYTFKLRKGIKFHNGDLVTVEDVKYSLDRVMGTETGKPLMPDFEKVEKVEVVDDETISIQLKEIDASLLSKLTVAIVPKSNEEHFADHPIGTGPFKFGSYLPEQSVTIEKFNEYWKDGLPHLDKVEFRIMPDREAALLSFKAGEIDMYPRLPNDRVEELGDGFETVSGPQNLVQLMIMNNAKEPFNDIRVRKAINYAVDVDEIIEAVAFGYGEKLGSNMSPVMKKYYQDGLEDMYNVNIEKAKQLLKEAGYEDGFKTKISIPSNYQFYVDMGEVIVQQLEKVGIHAKIELVEWGVWLDRIYKGRDYDMTIIGFSGKLDPNKILRRYCSNYSKNLMNYKNAKYDQLIEQANTEVNQEKRAKIYKEAQKILAEDAVCVFIMDPQFTVAMNKNIKGYKLYPIYVQDMSSIDYKE
ncbi:ABC transporter substrate-binding protein [Crassaminicella profunda]|uniref:ABC transporter substrate-binding protein n=1 Tax=Crassaminicella profunda TaxID=1286698 RepID=UPI001CA7672A|nr:ABC transporter substrate-binding protein [Crassaminicella profunda]QZY53731.1 ABC transporter substrate-binding protein [Crassaminicella profunda]